MQGLRFRKFHSLVARSGWLSPIVQDLPMREQVLLFDRLAGDRSLADGLVNPNDGIGDPQPIATRRWRWLSICDARCATIMEQEKRRNPR